MGLKEVVYFVDTGKSEVGDATIITGYVQLNGGDQFSLPCTDVSVTGGKAGNSSPDLGVVDANGYYKEAKVKHNSVSNRVFTLTGVIDKNIVAHAGLKLTLFKMNRSPAVFAFKSELTVDADNPNSVSAISGQSEFTAGDFMYVVVKEVTMKTVSSDTNIIDFNMVLELTT